MGVRNENKCKRAGALALALLMVLFMFPMSAIQSEASSAKPSIPSKATVLMNSTKKLKISPKGYSVKRVKVKSSKASVAKVSVTKSAVTVYGIKSGGSTLTVQLWVKKGKTNKKFTLKSKVTVKAPSASISKTSLKVGGTAKIKVSNLASGSDIRYSSSNSKAASVNSSGKVTAKKAGSVKITVKADLPGTNYADSRTITVKTFTVKIKETVVPVSSIKLDKSKLELAPGASRKLTATVIPSNATDKKVVWSSSDSKTAKVSNGTVEALKKGSAVITAECGGKSAFCLVSVVPETIGVSGVKLDTNEKTLTEGQSFTLSATVLPDDATDRSLSWSSSNPSAATVSSDGLVTGIASGNSTITVKAGNGKKDSCTVSVVPPASEEKTVTNQWELTSALQDSSLRKLTILTEANVELVIPYGDYSNVELNVITPNADITNRGRFREINIMEIATHTWTEQANGNIINLLNEKGIHIVVSDGYTPQSITAYAGSDGEVVIDVNGGSVNKIDISSEVKAVIRLNDDADVSNININSTANVVIEAKDNSKTDSIKVSAAGAEVDVRASGNSRVASVEVTAPRADVSVHASGNATAESVKLSGEASNTMLQVAASGAGNIQSVSSEAPGAYVNVISTGNGSVDNLKIEETSLSALIGNTENVTKVDLTDADRSSKLEIYTPAVEILTDSSNPASIDNIVSNYCGEDINAKDEKGNQNKIQTEDSEAEENDTTTVNFRAVITNDDANGDDLVSYGDTLTAMGYRGGSSNEATGLSFQWCKNGLAIDKAVSNTFTIKSSIIDVSDIITCKVSTTDETVTGNKKVIVSAPSEVKKRTLKPIDFKVTSLTSGGDPTMTFASAVKCAEQDADAITKYNVTVGKAGEDPIAEDVAIQKDDTSLVLSGIEIPEKTDYEVTVTAVLDPKIKSETDSSACSRTRTVKSLDLSVPAAVTTTDMKKGSSQVWSTKFTDEYQQAHGENAARTSERYQYAVGNTSSLGSGTINWEAVDDSDIPVTYNQYIFVRRTREGTTSAGASPAYKVEKSVIKEAPAPTFTVSGENGVLEKGTAEGYTRFKNSFVTGIPNGTTFQYALYSGSKLDDEVVWKDINTNEFKPGETPYIFFRMKVPVDGLPDSEVSAEQLIVNSVIKGAAAPTALTSGNIEPSEETAGAFRFNTDFVSNYGEKYQYLKLASDAIPASNSDWEPVTSGPVEASPSEKVYLRKSVPEDSPEPEISKPYVLSAANISAEVRDSKSFTKAQSDGHKLLILNGTNVDLGASAYIGRNENLTVPEDASLKVSSSLMIFGTLTNSGTITNGGTLTNSGTITNGGTLTNSGTITNNGTLNTAEGEFTNNGTTDNQNTITGLGVITGNLSMNVTTEQLRSVIENAKLTDPNDYNDLTDLGYVYADNMNSSKYYYVVLACSSNSDNNGPAYFYPMNSYTFAGKKATVIYGSGSGNMNYVKSLGIDGAELWVSDKKFTNEELEGKLDFNSEGAHYNYNKAIAAGLTRVATYSLSSN